MDFNDSPEEAGFRKEVRAWLAAHAPAHALPEGVKLTDSEQVERGRAWQREIFNGGYAGILLPKSVGGRGGTIIEAVVFDEEEAKYDLPKGPYIGIGLSMALPVLARHGTEQQIARFTEATLKGDLIWCQLFSEPAAGSDLAAVRTRAVREGDAYIVNGQKVWSSWAHEADWGILVARTDPSVPKHKGLSFYVLDMKSPGVETRPIRQISGASDFNETFMTDVSVPQDCMIGAEGEGWACCMTVLTGERLSQGGEDGGVAELISEHAYAEPGQRLALAEAYAEEQAERYFQARLRTMVSRGENPGALAAMVKLSYASRLQRMGALAMELRGMDALAPAEANDPFVHKRWDDYVWASALRIAGGADEVLRNQIAERVLGMPGEYRADKDVPFEQLK